MQANRLSFFMIVSRLMARNNKPRDVAGFLDLDQITVGGTASTRAAVTARRQWQSPMRSEQPLRSGAGLVQVVASKHDAILADTAEARVRRPAALGATARGAYVDEEDEDRTAITRPGPAAAYGPGPAVAAA